MSCFSSVYALKISLLSLLFLIFLFSELFFVYLKVPTLTHHMFWQHWHFSLSSLTSLLKLSTLELLSSGLWVCAELVNVQWPYCSKVLQTLGWQLSHFWSLLDELFHPHVSQHTALILVKAKIFMFVHGHFDNWNTFVLSSLYYLVCSDWLLIFTGRGPIDEVGFE